MTAMAFEFEATEPDRLPPPLEIGPENSINYPPRTRIHGCDG